MGVFHDPACDDGREWTNHAVLLVGYGTDTQLGDYWIVYNNWGYTWGENGFARMTRNALINCGIASAAIFPQWRS